VVISSPIKETGTIEQIKNLYAAKGEYDNLLLFLLGINTGANLKDLLELNAGDIKGKHFLTFEGKKSVPLSAEIRLLAESCTKNKHSSSPLFIGYKKSRLDRTAVFYKFKMICSELALGADINVSSWRKTFGYHHYKKYRDLSYLQWFFNQQSIDATMQYIGIEENMNLRYREGVCL